MSDRIRSLEAATIRAFERRADAIRTLNATLTPGSDEYRQVALSLPDGVVRDGIVTVEVIVPRNRTSYRAPHTRFFYWLNGKPATRDLVASWFNSHS